ncbi:amidase [uncultured Erythrobacter sp.]|uniref:amidase n=1 Tax=uncultured Erythrobacter sp. TaxID=263913 RepID=UPI00260F4D0F|nr:amidase [uncultured Erythrobacter sp.]
MIDRYNAFLYRDDNASGGEGALAGLTIGVKANISVKGMPFHAGVGAWEGRVADADAEVVKRLRAEGAVISGILNMEEGALGAKTDNPHFGPTQNPHREGYSPGGSSGGSGAAVAAGLCDAALGTDTMGSVRIPAAHCGVYGFKPATDRVRQDGLIPAEPLLDAIGPLARDLDTLERVARVMSDFGEADIAGPGATLVEHGVEVEPDVTKVFEKALSVLPAQPKQTSLSESNSRIRFAGFIKTSLNMAADLEGVKGLSPNLRKLLTYGPDRPEKKLALDMDVLNQMQFEVQHIVKKHGFLILPTVPNTAFPHSDPEPAAQADFTCLANIAGLPAISIPAGWTRDGLPVGIQIIGAGRAEAGLFRLARHIDNKLSAYRAPQSMGETT